MADAEASYRRGYQQGAFVATEAAENSDGPSADWPDSDNGLWSPSPNGDIRTRQTTET
jgi:hypothetical protein